MKISVLVVDDSEVCRQVAKHMLLSVGCDVITAKDGQEAVALTEGILFDAIFMDYDMPIMDGCTAAKLIKADHPKINICAMTANDSPDNVQDCRCANMDSFIVKPVKIEDFVHFLAKNTDALR